MKPGISSYAFGWAVRESLFTTDALLEFAVEQGLAVIQIGDHLPLHRQEVGALATFAARAREAGVEIEAGARGMKPGHLETYIGISERLGAKLLRFVIDEAGYEPAMDEVIRVVRGALPALERAGVTLGIENHDRFSTATLRGIVDEVGSDRVGVCLDTANSLGAGEGIMEVLEHLGPVCVNLHVKDFVIARVPYLMGFTVSGSPLGEGMLPLGRVLEAVQLNGRCETAVIETWPPPEPEMSATLAKEREWARRAVGVLRAALESPVNLSSKPELLNS